MKEKLSLSRYSQARRFFESDAQAARRGLTWTAQVEK